MLSLINKFLKFVSLYKNGQFVQSYIKNIIFQRVSHAKSTQRYQQEVNSIWNEIKIEKLLPQKVKKLLNFHTSIFKKSR